MMRRFLSCMLLLLLSVFISAAPGVSDTAITLGQSCALTGPTKELGIHYSTGINCYLASVNRNGGINGRKINLISKDDGYEANLAKENTIDLIEKENAFLLIGEVGTPTSRAVYPYTKEHNIPFIAPLTGAEYLRKPFKPNVVNIRASYFQEMNALIKYIIAQDRKKIACFYQNDSYGKAGLDGLMKQCFANNIPLISSGSYERNSNDVTNALSSIFQKEPDVVVMVGAYEACAAFITEAKKEHPNTLYCNLSFVGTEALIKELGTDGEGVIVSQVVPFPYDQSLPVVKEYQSEMKQFGAEDMISFVSLEGFLAGKLFCEVLSSIEGDITRESFMNTLEQTGTWNLGGLDLTFSENDHQGLDTVFLTMIKNQKIVQLK